VIHSETTEKTFREVINELDEHANKDFIDPMDALLM